MMGLLLQLYQKNKKDKRYSNVTCHQCGETRHYANEIAKCKAATEKGPEKSSGVTATTVSGEEVELEDTGTGTSFKFCACHVEAKHFNTCKSNKKVPNTWVLLDNPSTVNVFYNKDLLKNIREVNTKMNIHCNSGVSTTNLVGDQPGYGTVWLDEDGIANILSLAREKRNHEVSFNSE